MLFEMVARDQAVDDEAGAEKRQRHECEADAHAVKILGQGRANLGADRRARLHDEGDEDVDVSLHGMFVGTDAGRHDDFEKIGPDGNVGRNAEQINRRMGKPQPEKADGPERRRFR